MPICPWLQIYSYAPSYAVDSSNNYSPNNRTSDINHEPTEILIQ